MAEPVIVPVQLEVTDIDMSNVNLADVQKDISAKMSGIKKSIQDGFKGIDASAINKPIESAMNSVKKSLQAAEDAQLKYNETLIRAGKSSQEYKSAVTEADSAIRNQESFINELSQLGPVVAPQLAEAKRKLDALIEARNKINPLDFVDKAEPIQLEKVANAYQKVISAISGVNKQSEKFNQTVQDNKLTDEYNEYLKQAEKYKTKLEELDTKSKRMEALGATDKQWEALRYDTEQVSTAMDDLIKKMREAVKTGTAFRFGEGNKQELRNQIQSFAMSSQNRAGYIQDRAMKNESPYTADYQAALNELDKLEKKVEAIREKSAKMIELGASTSQFASLSYDAEQLDVKVDEVKNSLMAMVNNSQAFKFGNGNAAVEIENVRNSAGSLQSTLSGVKQSADLAQGGLTAIGATHPKLAAVLTVASKIASGFGKVLTVAGKAATGIVKGFAGAVKVLSQVGSSVGKVASGFINLGKRIFSGIKNIKLFGKSGSSATNSMNAGFKKFTKNFLMFGLGFRTAYYAIKRLRNIFVESFQLMGDKFDEVGKPLAKFMESLNRLKGSVATAFQPIVSVVMPILTRFMNYLSSALESVGKFMATLTGQGRIYKAVAKSINSVAQAAKNANKELGSYDKLEVIKQNDLGYDYEQQDIGATEDAASNFANMVKEAWKNADFTSVGAFVSTKLLEILDNVEKTIIPKAVGFVNKLLRSVNTFLAGFDATAIGDKIGSIVNTIVYGVEWDQLGSLFGNMYGEVFDFVDGLINRIDWATVGQSLATSVNSLFTALDLGSIGTTINTTFNSLMTLIANFFETVDWSGIATAFATGINNIFSGDSSAFNSAITALNNAITTVVSMAITTINWESIFDTLNGALEHLFRSAGESLTATDNPMLQSVGDMFTAIADSAKMLGPMTKEVISLLAPLVSVILTEAAKILPGIIEFTAKFTSVVLPVLVKIIEQMLPTITDVVLRLLPLLMDLLTALEPVFGVIVDDVLPQVVELTYMVTDLIFDILGLIVSILVPLLPTIAKLLEIVCEVVGWVLTLLEPLFSIIGTLCDALGQILQPILEALIPVFDAINAVIEMLTPIIDMLIMPLNVLAGVFKIIVGIIVAIVVPALDRLTGFIGVLATVVKSLANVFTVVFATIRDVIITFWNGVKPILNWIIAGIESISNGVIKAVNGMIKALNKLSFDVPDWVPGMGGKKFGFNLREVSTIKIPRLAQGAVIPPNNEFLAMLGDQKHGTNIEAPLDTIKQALAEVLAEIGGGNREPIILQVNGRTLAKVVWDEQEKRYKQTGKYSMA